MNTSKIEALAISEWQREQQSKTREIATRILDLKRQHLSLSVQWIEIDARLDEIEAEIRRLGGSI